MIVPSQCLKWTRLHRSKGDYSQSIADDFAMIAPHLPETVTSILDIGCGMAGIDVYLKQRYPDAHLSLLDSDGERSNSGFVGGAGGNREATQALLAANGIKPDRWYDIGTQDLLAADLVISLLSWGFHYPLSTYRVKGRCVADIRRHHEQVRGKIIRRANRSDRCMWDNF